MKLGEGSSGNGSSNTGPVDGRTLPSEPQAIGRGNVEATCKSLLSRRARRSSPQTGTTSSTSPTKAPMGTYALASAVAVTTAGEVTVAGYWWGENTFHQNTPYQTVMKSESLLVGNNFHRAEDPFFTRTGLLLRQHQVKLGIACHVGMLGSRRWPLPFHGVRAPWIVCFIIRLVRHRSPLRPKA